MKDEPISTLRKMLIRQCKIAYRLGDEKQKQEAEFFHRIIAAAKTTTSEDRAK